MIAKLSSGGVQVNRSQSAAQNSAQCKRKRAKLLDLLLNSNWSKQSQQANNLLKLNKCLLVCDANFLDEKSGQSPLSLAISSSQINPSPGAQSPLSSASLFTLQCQSTGINQLMLKQTHVSDLAQSRAPLVERLILLLVKAGALIDFRNCDGRTPLHMAAMKSNFWALKTLLELGASTDYRDINGLTPLYYSILHKADLKVTQLLLNHNKNPSSSYYNSDSASQPSIGITDQHGWQEVHHACKLGLDAHLEKLLYYGCDINAKISGSGNTPIHVAAINDQLNCAKVLLIRGADKSITNNSHQTAHQVAVIANNMDLAEFIADHNETKMVPFSDRPANFVDMSRKAGTFSSMTDTRLSTRSSPIASSQSWITTSSNHHQPRASIQPRIHQEQHLNSLSLDFQPTNQPITNSLNSSYPQSLLSIASHYNQPNIQISNISPCLSQRSYATSNTTSSSGVCCDGEGSNSAEELQQQLTNNISNSQSEHSNITIVSINNKNNGSNRSILVDDNACDLPELKDEDDLRSSGSGSSSSNGLYSIMSEEKPLYAGTIVEATSEYQSGDPDHLQLRRGDLVEVLECARELLQAGQLPRLANKPMLFGRRQSDGLSGLFPSFCVRRAKKTSRRSTRSQRFPFRDVSNSDSSNFEALNGSLQSATLTRIGVRGLNLPGSQSMAALDKQPQLLTSQQADLKSKFRELQVSLSKTNEGFGFVLRGAKVDPVTLAACNGKPNKLTIDENLMSANNLVSLQYLDEIEQGSVAQQAGLKRGDFLVAVNHRDVRLCSHEQVVHMIRQSGDQVHLTIATPLTSSNANQAVQVSSQAQLNYHMSKTLGRKVKPEPPKRDPNTTLTRNKAQRVKSMLIQPIQHHQQQEPFDANKPLPTAPSNVESPISPTGSLNMNRAMSANQAHSNSVQSLSSVTDSHSVSSISTLSTDQQPHQQQQQPSLQATPTLSSSSTATLTTVATMKPKAPPKPTSTQINGQLIYQPAVIITTRRVSQSNTSVIPNPPSPANSAAAAPVPQPMVVQEPQAPPPLARALTPPPPPPPPPLPEFPETPVYNRASQRRDSAPINKSAAIMIDSDRLQKKRESLATFSQLSERSSIVPVPAQFGAVAAACAAAANNRLQRRQQSQPDKSEQHQQQSPQSQALLQLTQPLQEQQPLPEPQRPQQSSPPHQRPSQQQHPLLQKPLPQQYPIQQQPNPSHPQQQLQQPAIQQIQQQKVCASGKHGIHEHHHNARNYNSSATALTRINQSHVQDPSQHAILVQQQQQQQQQLLRQQQHQQLLIQQQLRLQQQRMYLADKHAAHEHHHHNNRLYSADLTTDTRGHHLHGHLQQPLHQQLLHQQQQVVAATKAHSHHHHHHSHNHSHYSNHSHPTPNPHPHNHSHAHHHHHHNHDPMANYNNC